MNNIQTIQTTAPQIARLRAQRRLYSSAKNLLGMQVILSAPFALVWSIVGIFHPESKALAALWGIAVALLDILFFTPRQKVLKSKAAGIQEAFDCDVLSMEWRTIRAGARPLPEDIVKWSGRKKLDKKDKDDENGWYPKVVSVLPISLARIVCQRANCWWDAELRRRYATVALTVVLGTFAVSVAAGVIGHFQLDQWLLTGVVPMIPVFILGLRQYKEQTEAAQRLDTLRGHAERLWKEALAGAGDDRLAQQSRELQDDIYDNRRRSPLIFDWLYEALRDPHEEQMNAAADHLVEEARKQLGL